MLRLLFKYENIENITFSFYYKISNLFSDYANYAHELEIRMNDKYAQYQWFKNATIENKSKNCINFSNFIIMQAWVLDIVFQSFKHFKFLHKWTTQILINFQSHEIKKEWR